MFATAAIVIGRRGKEFTEVEQNLYLDLYEQTRLERERAFQRAQDRKVGEYWPVAAARPYCTGIDAIPRKDQKDREDREMGGDGARGRPGRAWRTAVRASAMKPKTARPRRKKELVNWLTSS